MRLRLRADFIPSLAVRDLRAINRMRYSTSRFVAPRGSLTTFYVDPSGRWIDQFQWGLVPPITGASLPAGGREISTQQDVLEKPTIRDALTSRRCAVLVNGFAVLPEAGRHARPQLATIRGAEWFAVAGLWTLRRCSPDAEATRCCTVITAPASERLRRFAAALPVVLERASIERWCGPSTGLDELAPMLRPRELPFEISSHDYPLA